VFVQAQGLPCIANTWTVAGTYSPAFTPDVHSATTDYYVGLVTSEYQNSPNFLAWLRGHLSVLSDSAAAANSINPNFDIDLAVGVQLDILGQIIGQSRTVGFQPTASPPGSVSPVLDDPTYRLLLKARIAQNQWDGTIDGLQAAWKYLFPSGSILIIDNQDMTADISISGSFSSIINDLINNGYIVPRSEGVLYRFSATLPILGADRNDAYQAGADLGHAL
jgi:hypothetical protein